ncbi:MULTISPECIES: PXPV repeat protein [Burkholderia]|uniref:PXPV repeat protein n=2 Tax=Burkholderia humptydooensis TaxID=430531 RepID=A0A7U4SRP3_9BURK|nr:MULTISPECIES: PXPV repeat protein [Burkholderia]AGK46489.1 PXPV repeat family protein [Burkholderia thailandensis MSMB121]ATF37271.1 hypothetical protein CO709_31320 [Burkholderia thailandensis]AJY43065.1 PXPV repeat family protein [Burkholderia sp. 2002721687]ALX42816.1 hypothetical protein AQ610_10605 [Burkholderia humptydooensis]KST74643.1 hypothetical protein WS76_11075 [Burkholderia humptydooensis]
MKKLLTSTMLGVAALMASGAATAGGVDLSIGVGVPVAPVYVAPEPVYVAPQPAVVGYPAYYGGWRGDDDEDYWKHYRKHWRKWHRHHDDDDD